jgi:8-oxo-dGTP diphosphatase
VTAARGGTPTGTAIGTAVSTQAPDTQPPDTRPPDTQAPGTQPSSNTAVPAPAPALLTVDVVALTVRADRLEALLIRRPDEPYRGGWALPGGFVGAEEDLPAAAARTLAAETGQHGLAAHLEQLASYGRPDRDPRGRVVTVAYLAFAPAGDLPRMAGNPADVRWCPVAELASAGQVRCQRAAAQPAANEPTMGTPAANRPPGRWLAFDHETILADGVERARAKLEYSALGTAFCTEPFTAAELRRVYEAVWGVPLDPRNFWRKVSSTPGLLVPVPGRSVPGPTGGRPAARFRRGPATMLHPPILRPH